MDIEVTSYVIDASFGIKLQLTAVTEAHAVFSENNSTAVPTFIFWMLCGHMVPFIKWSSSSLFKFSVCSIFHKSASYLQKTLSVGKLFASQYSRGNLIELLWAVFF